MSDSDVPPSDRTAVDPLWEIWRRLVAEFSLGRMVQNLTFSRSGWGMYSVDVISTLRATKMGKGALAVIAGLSDAELSRLAALAELNARRNEAIWRMAALFYVTVPASLFLAGLQGAPAIVQEMLGENVLLVVVLVVVLTLWLLYYFSNNWRARQIEALVDLARIERDGLPLQNPGAAR